MLLSGPLSDILNIANKLRDGVDIRKCKVDGKTMQVESGKMQAEDSLNAIGIICTYRDRANTVNIEAHPPKSDVNNVVKIEGAEMDEADIDMTLIPPSLQR